MDSQDLSNTAPSPSRTPSQVIAGADRELEAVLAWGSRKMGGYLVFRAVLAGEARIMVEAGTV
ncbi:MAG: hypothetical protein QM330_01485 [Acidobacteriota bacterium]|nr:hypothetical protein [Acidobacteriota bacterium]